jgi:lipoprotein-releasing system permease protein
VKVAGVEQKKKVDGGFEFFIAWRYIRDRKFRVSPTAIIAAFTFGYIALCAYGLMFVTRSARVVGGLDSIAFNNAKTYSAPDWLVLWFPITVGIIAAGGLAYFSMSRKRGSFRWVILVVTIMSLIAGAMALLVRVPFLLNNVDTVFMLALRGIVLVIYFGFLRLFFTFFSTVSILGVWIGTSALVSVLAIMGGFENDLRQKILGSNAHIQITRNDNVDFTNWREVRDKIAGIQDVVASTPYASSEVVLAANSNGSSVIIKGIDPATVGSVTKLVRDLDGPPDEDKAAMKRLYPLIDESMPRDVPQLAPGNAGSAPPVQDKAPNDMPAGADPLDLSAPPPAKADNGGEPILSIDPPPSAKAGNDPAPDDFVAGDEEGPTDFTKPNAMPLTPDMDDAGIIHTIDIPMENSPALSRRTQSLPGIFVGRELVKSTHLYIGKEVRLVSPLSDPSNPDATGTPIPFNRDYRVAGVFFTGMYEYDLKYVYVTLDSFQEFLDRGDVVDGIEVAVKDPSTSLDVVKRIKLTLGASYDVKDWTQINSSLFSALKLEKIAMFLVLGIVIVVASFSILGNLIMVVVEKGQEIALLKTLGASDSSVILIFVIQGLIIGFVGTVLGIATGLGVAGLVRSQGTALNAEVYYIDKVPIHVDPGSVVLIALAGVLVSMLATIYPAYLASKIRPAYGLKQI